jgi:imidazolonepropionase-like amidohydrolase
MNVFPRCIRRSLFAAILCFLTALPVAGQVAVEGDKIFTMAGAVISNGVVLIRDGKIEAVGRRSGVSIPPGYKTLQAKVVTPGLIDAHTVVGLSGILNQPQDQEQLEKSAPMQPELRALDSYNALDPLVEWIRSFGVTTIHTGHAPGALISGQTMILKTSEKNISTNLLNPAAMIACTLGRGALAAEKKSPGTSAKAVAMLRTEFIKAREYSDKLKKAADDKKPPRDLHLEALVQILDGKIPLLVTVDRHQDILAALRVAKEFQIKLVLDGMSDAPLVLDDIKASGFPVLLHPTMARPAAEAENLSMETAAKLKKAGIPFALQSGYESYVPKTRVVLFEAAIAAANGLAPEEALAAITIDAAKILGVADRVGSIEKGKDGDLALYDGDPFEYTSHCIGVVISGNVMSGPPH